jgi:hypothetical protein
MGCTAKWLGAINSNEVGIVVLRPDGYVGTVGRFISRSKENGMKAARWLDEYFDGTLTRVLTKRVMANIACMFLAV